MVKKVTKRPTNYWTKTSLEIGKQYLFRSVTHYYVGRLVNITDTDLILEDAAWVADTGRFSNALNTGTLNEVEPFIKPVIVFRSGLIDATEWTGKLPADLK